MPAIYIRLSTDEWTCLHDMADEERRDARDQAAHLVGQGLARWQAQKDFEASLPPFAEEEGVPAA